MATGGPLESFTINNRRFAVDGEANVSVIFPGHTNEVKPNGDGSNRIIKSRKTGKLDKIPIVIDNDRGDMEFIQEVMDNFDFVSCFAVEVDGTVWEGNMMITGEPEKSTKESTMEITVEGTLSRQGA
jgi:hypothetical protein